jgi:pyruvate/2-oxoglutarate dehydrogenase complex dihydrolipoamide acyltransferase (E2) component
VAVQPVIMPKLGAYTEDVVLTAWLLAEGAEVAAGVAVLEMETDKTTAEVEADVSGWLHRLLAEGATVPIGTTVGLIATTPDEYEALLHSGTAAGGAAPYAETDEPGEGAEEDERPVVRTPARDGAAPISPRARAILRSHDLTVDEVAGLVGSGPGGRVLDRDVQAWLDAHDAAASGPPSGLTVRATVPLRGRRRTIAERMVASLQTAAQLTSVLELDVSPLVEFRNSTGATGGRRVGVTAIVVKLVANALLEHPALNARVTEDAIEQLQEINVGVAVDTADGIVVPVVRGADALSVPEIDVRITDLAARARAGELVPDDLADGTFTVSNGGIHPVDITTAILNPPQVAILWIGRISDRPVAVDGAVLVRPTMQACLTFDHRAVDGGPAAVFLGMLQRLIAQLPEVPV